MDQPTNVPVAPAAPAAPPQAETTVADSLPTTWPGAFGIYKYSKRVVRLNLANLVALWLIDIVVQFILQIVLRQVGNILAYFISPLFLVCVTIIYLAGLRGQTVQLEQVIKQAIPFWLKAIGLQILVFLSYFGSIILFIVPFFFVYPRLTLTNYYLIDKKLGVLEAYTASWNATKGHAGKAWGIFGASLAMALLVLTIIGIPFAVYFLVMYSAAYSVLYGFITKSQPDAPTQSGKTTAAASTPAPAS